MALLLAGGAVGFSLLQTPLYQSYIQILVRQNAPPGTAGNLQGEVQGLQQLTQTMAQAVDTPPVAEAVIRQLDLRMTPGDILENLNASQVRATQFIQVEYTDSDPDRAQQIANAVGDAFSTQITELRPSTSAVTATVWTRAELPREPVSPRPARNGIVALAVGAMLGVALAFLLEYLDNSSRSPEKAERTSSVAHLKH